MKISKIEELNEGEVLGQDVIANDYQILLGRGTILKNEYIQKLKELGVREVCIQDDKSVDQMQISILREEIEQTFFYKVKEVLENHTYQQQNRELAELSRTADVIITEILEDDHVVEKVYDIKERSADLYKHSISLCTLATVMALKYKFDRNTIHDMGVACLLHDLGLRYLTIEYKNQNVTDLSEMEYAEYKKHPIYAYMALRNEDWISDKAKNMILMHHEHIDGSGYPLHATNIPKEIQIISACDIFDEMICGIGCIRYKVCDAIEYLKKSSGIHFAKDIIATLLKLVAMYPVGTKVLTNQSEIGIVLRQNHGFPDKPIIRIIEDKDGKTVSKDLIKNLLEETDILIEKAIDD